MADVTAEQIVEAKKATEWRRSQIQGFYAVDARVLYIRDLVLPPEEQRVWERQEHGDGGTYDEAHTAMMEEIMHRQYRVILDHIAATTPPE